MIQSLSARFRPRHLAMVGICLLAAAFLYLLRYDNYGIEEGAARALLINWSIVHRIANPIAFFGVPDLRAILFIPLDLHWAGSLPAAKVFTMLFLFAAVLMMHRWSAVRDDEEVAMLASGLLLISPICLMQIDAIGSGVYLLFGFISIFFLHGRLRSSADGVPSDFFLLMLLVAFVVSLHPIGMAAPIALLIAWRRIGRHRRRRLIMAAITATATGVALLRWGWSGMEDPGAIPSVLGDIWLGPPMIHPPHLWLGYLIGLLLLAALVAIPIWRRLDLMAGMLLVAGLIGLYHPDHAWALVVAAFFYYLGIPVLIRLNSRIGGGGMAGQRGLVLLVVALVAMLCSQSGKAMSRIRTEGLKSPTDLLISVVARDAADLHRPFLAASQWPGRTMLATRRDVFPLPPADGDVERFKRNIAPLTHILFDERNPAQRPLVESLATVTGAWETVAITEGGVVLRRRSGGTEVAKKR